MIKWLISKALTKMHTLQIWYLWFSIITELVRFINPCIIIIISVMCIARLSNCCYDMIISRSLNIHLHAGEQPERCRIHRTAASTRQRNSVPRWGTCSSPCKRPSASAPSPPTPVCDVQSSAMSDVADPSTCSVPMKNMSSMYISLTRILPTHHCL